MVTLHAAKVSASMTLIRTPMLSQTAQVVALTDISFNTEISVIRRLSKAAKKAHCVHGVVLMVELGDLREGIMPKMLEQTISAVLRCPNILFMGIGTNLACRSGVSPDQRNMAELSALADSIDAIFGPIVHTVSGGNSANLEWALSTEDTGRINNLRLGESMLLGCEPLHRKPIQGLHTDAMTLIAEVIELKVKPAQPWGTFAQAAFGKARTSNATGNITQAILAIGRQDIDPDGLVPPAGIEILSASSDHLVIDISNYLGAIKVGTQISFQLDYSALLRAMTSPFITHVMKAPKIENRPEKV